MATAPGLSYQWQILQRWHPPGPTSPVPPTSSYELTSAEEGQQVRVLVAYIDGEGFSESVTTSSVGVGLVDDGDAVFSITGTPEVGQTLTASLDASDPDGDGACLTTSGRSSSDGTTWSDIAGATDSRPTR